MNANGKPTWDEEESADSYDHDADRLDLSPRTAVGAQTPVSPTRKVVPVVVIIAIVAALGFVLVQGLNDAALFYYNVDEVVERQGELGDKRIRMQGNVIEGSVEETATGVSFTITFHDVSVPVQHIGDPPELFKPDIPVILEGEYRDGTFHSDEILIRHDNTYEEEHQDRLREAEVDIELRQENAE